MTAERMIKQRQRGILIKEYYALVKGNPPEEGILEIPMEEMRDARDGDKLKMKVGKSENAKTAKTFFQVVKRFEKFSLVSLVIETGRTHQIRFHMASIGCPLWEILFMEMVRTWDFKDGIACTTVDVHTSVL